MNFELRIAPKVEKWLEKFAKKNLHQAQKIVLFIDKLKDCKNPLGLPNVKN